MALIQVHELLRFTKIIYSDAANAWMSQDKWRFPRFRRFDSGFWPSWDLRCAAQQLPGVSQMDDVRALFFEGGTGGWVNFNKQWWQKTVSCSFFWGVVINQYEKSFLIAMFMGLLPDDMLGYIRDIMDHDTKMSRKLKLKHLKRSSLMLIVQVSGLLGLPCSYCMLRLTHTHTHIYIYIHR